MNRDSRLAWGAGVGGLAVLALSGCVAVPASMTIASFAFDGMSYAATGKSTNDHALSAVTGEDCALWRVVKDKPVCAEPAKTGAKEVFYGNGDALAFSPPAMTPLGAPAPANEPQRVPEAAVAAETLPPPVAAPTPHVAAIPPAAPLAVPPVAASTPPLRVPAPAKAATPKAQAAVLAPSANGGRKVYVVYASFQDVARAAAASGAANGTRVMPAMIDGRKMYRVVAGPFDAERAEAVRRNAASGAWLLPL